MRTLKGWITTTCLVAMLMLSTTAVKADGVIIAGRGTTPCSEATVKEKVDYGVIIAGITGVIIAGFTGVIIAGATDGPVNCGVIIAG